MSEHPKAILLGFCFLAGTVSHGISAAPPSSVASVITTCAPVIQSEYHGDRSKWGSCVQATEWFLAFATGPNATFSDFKAVASELAEELGKLYRNAEDCQRSETELSAAISTVWDAYVAAGGAPISEAHPATVAEVIQLCAPVIDTEYKGDRSPWGKCIAAADYFVRLVVKSGQDSEARQELAVELVDELAKLYQGDDACRAAETELPEAIQRASGLTTEVGQSEAIPIVAETICSCETGSTGLLQAAPQVSPN